MGFTNFYPIPHIGLTMDINSMNTKNFFLVFFIALFFSFSCCAIEVAFFDVDDSGDVYLHTPKTLNQRDRITVLRDDPKSGCCLFFSGGDFLKIDKSETVSSVEDGRQVMRYKLALKKHSELLNPQVSAVIIGNVSVKSSQVGKVHVLSSGKTYVIETCYGIEGRNLYLKDKDKQIQHLYYYFNVDIESNCK